MANSAPIVLKMIKEHEVEWVDVRFTDPRGKWQHLTMCAEVIDEDVLEEGFMFDGSSIEGWKTINESDMILRPDLDASISTRSSATPMLILSAISSSRRRSTLLPRSALDRQAGRSLSEINRYR